MQSELIHPSAGSQTDVMGFGWALCSSQQIRQMRGGEGLPSSLRSDILNVSSDSAHSEVRSDADLLWVLLCAQYCEVRQSKTWLDCGLPAKADLLAGEAGLRLLDSDCVLERRRFVSLRA